MQKDMPESYSNLHKRFPFSVCDAFISVCMFAYIYIYIYIYSHTYTHTQILFKPVIFSLRHSLTQHCFSKACISVQFIIQKISMQSNNKQCYCCSLLMGLLLYCRVMALQSASCMICCQISGECLCVCVCVCLCVCMCACMLIRSHTFTGVDELTHYNNLTSGCCR